MDGPGAFVGGVSESVTIVGAADSSAKSRIPVSASHVTVSANTNDTNDWIVLPTGVRDGRSITGWSTVAHEIRTEASSNIKINGQDGDGTKGAAIPATTLWRATYINSTFGWILNAWDELAAPITAIIPD